MGVRVTPRGTIEVEIQSEETAIVVLHGEHDMATTTEISIALAVAAGCPSILVDVSDCTFIDSTVIGVMLRAAVDARGRAGVLEVVVPRDSSARRGLEIAGVDHLLKFHETREAGIARLDAIGLLRLPRGARRDLRSVSAKIADLQARTKAGRARIAATNAGVVIVRAHVGDAKLPSRTRTRRIA
jgi:anti-anti-sigma factor